MVNFNILLVDDTLLVIDMLMVVTYDHSCILRVIWKQGNRDIWFEPFC